jgi:SAM-dependent MidA family methyltransferase
MVAETSIPVSADALAHSQRVSAFLRLEIERAGGWLAFSDWMGHALYAPGLGYYSAGSVKLATAQSDNPKQLSGDFVTAPQLTPLFGYTLANQIAEVLRQSEANTILEFGAGSGALADDILTALTAQGIEANYQILEVSGDLKLRQQARLAKWQGRVTWLDQTPSHFRGCVVANEVLDAMPVELFSWSLNGQLMQRGVSWDGQQFQFEDRPASSALTATVSQRMPVLPDYRSELNLQAESWVQGLGSWLTRGAALLIDYGFPQHEYYHPQRHRGTLMCHIQHLAHDDAFMAPGLQDITAHVDFTAMADAALAGGLDVLGYTSQARFLLNAGLLDILTEQVTQTTTREQANMQVAIQKLTSEAEMGELFKVLALGRDIEGSLLGFTRGDRRHRL